MDDITLPLAGEPEVRVGWKQGSRLFGAALSIHQDVIPELRGIPDRAVAACDASVERTYEPSAELEAGEEYFRVSIANLPNPAARRRPHQQLADAVDRGILAELPHAADLVALMQAPQLDQLHAAELAERRLSFYGIVWSTTDGNIAFVKRANPTSIAKKGHVFMQYGDALRKVEAPDLVLYADVDLILLPDSIIVLDKRAFDQLLSDVRVVLQDVPANVTTLQSNLASKVPLGVMAVASLVRRCSSRPTLAARLRRVQSRIETLDLDAATLRASIEGHREDPARLVNSAGEFEFQEDTVPLFLDVIEGRLFEDDLTGERRRADRYSSR